MIEVDFAQIIREVQVAMGACSLLSRKLFTAKPCVLQHFHESLKNIPIGNATLKRSSSSTCRICQPSSLPACTTEVT